MNLYISIILSNFGSEIFDEQIEKQGTLHGHIQETFKEGWRKVAEKFSLSTKKSSEVPKVIVDKESMVTGRQYESSYFSARDSKTPKLSALLPIGEYKRTQVIQPDHSHASIRLLFTVGHLR